MLDYDLANIRQEELRREAAHDRLVDALSPQPRRNVFALVWSALVCCRAMVAELGRTKPVRRRVSTWIAQR